MCDVDLHDTFPIGAQGRTRSTLFPYTTLFRSEVRFVSRHDLLSTFCTDESRLMDVTCARTVFSRSEEHTYELKSQSNLIRRRLREKRNQNSSHSRKA